MDKKSILVLTMIISLGIYCLASSVRARDNSLENKKIGWGIKREDNHEQPDLGTENKKLIDNYNGIAMGNKESNKVYLTFDMGYEAGYTENILNTLHENDVTATFFITAHYLNTQPDLVKRMIEEGHIVGNVCRICLMKKLKKK